MKSEMEKRNLIFSGCNYVILIHVSGKKFKGKIILNNTLIQNQDFSYLQRRTDHCQRQFSSVDNRDWKLYLLMFAVTDLLQLVNKKQSSFSLEIIYIASESCYIVHCDCVKHITLCNYVNSLGSTFLGYWYAGLCIKILDPVKKCIWPFRRTT